MPQSTLEAQAIAKISYDDSINGLTQPYVSTSGGQEVFRHATYAGCERFISWHGYVLQDEQAIAQSEFEQHIEEQAEAIAPEIEIDGVESEDGTAYRVWNSYRFLGSFYQNRHGKWVAQPANTDCRSFCDTEYQAQLIILAMFGLVIPKSHIETVLAIAA